MTLDITQVILRKTVTEPSKRIFEFQWLNQEGFQIFSPMFLNFLISRENTALNKNMWTLLQVQICFGVAYTRLKLVKDNLWILSSAKTWNSFDSSRNEFTSWGASAIKTGKYLFADFKIKQKMTIFKSQDNCYHGHKGLTKGKEKRKCDCSALGIFNTSIQIIREKC